MSETTGISWTDKTWNPWQGCHRVSPGCAHCYMHTEKKRYGQDPTTVVRSKPPTFNAPRKWQEPAKVFTCSWSDFFIEEADAWRPEAWEIIRATPWLTYQVLTKRPERIAACLPEGWLGWPNVWLGVTVENADALWRAEELAGIPCAPGQRFMSVEPLLGPLGCDPFAESFSIRMTFGWVIVGGESGPGARPMNIEWAREVRDACRRWNVPFFMKQDSGPKPGRQGRIPDDLWVKEFPRVP